MRDPHSPLRSPGAGTWLTRRVGRIALALALTAAPTAARADADAPTDAPAEIAAHHDEVSIGGTTRALRSPSANALTGANLAGVTLSAARNLGHDLAISLAPGLTLWAEANLVTGSADGTMFQSLSTSIDELGLTGGLAARYRLHRRITAGAGVAVGAQRARVAITDRSGTAYDHGWGAMASATAALDVFLVAPPRRFGLGLRLEAGYVAAQGIALTLHTDRPGDAIPLTMTELSLGHLDLSGPSASLSLLGQF
jgi:hypothetical protein